VKRLDPMDILRHSNPLSPTSRICRSDSPDSHSVNLMPDDLPLIIRMRGSANFMDDSFINPQSEGSRFRARGPIILVKIVANPQTCRDLDKHHGIFDIDDAIQRFQT